MDIYKKASKVGLRFLTPRGTLNVEQLWNLPIAELDKLAVSYEEEYKKSNRKSFVVKRTAKDRTLKLCFDVVLDILTTKVNEQDASRKRLDDKKHNEKIYTLIAELEDNELKSKTKKELLAEIRA